MKTVLLAVALTCAVPALAGTPTFTGGQPFPHQYRYDLGELGCGVLDRSGGFVETYQCAVILTFNTSVTAMSASNGQSLRVESIHYQATTQIGASLTGRQVQFSGATTATPCSVNVLGLYNYALPVDLGPLSTQDWQENITPDGRVQLDCFVHVPYPQ